MNVPIASCMICGQERELASWVDPSITGGSYHGVCFSCREGAQRVRPIGWATVLVCEKCKADYDTSQSMCISCGKSVAENEALPEDDDEDGNIEGDGLSDGRGEEFGRNMKNEIVTIYIGEDACQQCLGWKRVDDGEKQSWKHWAELPEQSALAVRMGLVKPVECPRCHGTGIEPGEGHNEPPGE